MNIKIDIKNLPKIQAILNKVNGNATSHTFTGASEILRCAENAEKQLENLQLPKISRSGAISKATSGSSVARSYKYQRTISYAKMIRKSSAWFLVELSKFESWTTGAGTTSIDLTLEQDRKAIFQFRSRYGIH